MLKYIDSTNNSHVKIIRKKRLVTNAYPFFTLYSYCNNTKHILDPVGPLFALVTGTRPQQDGFHFIKRNNAGKDPACNWFPCLSRGRWGTISYV